MPMQFIVDQMTGNAPVTYYPQQKNQTPRDSRARWLRIPDSKLLAALKMREQGKTWDAIGRELGHSGHGMAGALKRRGLL